MDGGAHTSEIRSWSGTPPCAVDSWQDVMAVFILWGRWGDTSYRGTDIRLAHQLHGNLAKEYDPHGSFDKDNHWLGRRYACRKVGHVSRV